LNSAIRQTAAADGPCQVARVLVATHGENRGRSSAFVATLLDLITEWRPNLAQQVAVWRTGSPLPSLDNINAVVFLLADPIDEHPSCQTEAQRLAKCAKKMGLRVLNPPGALNNTVKSRQAMLWAEAGIPSAKAYKANNEAAVTSLLESVQYPIILRPDRLHVQAGMTFCLNAVEAQRAVRRLRYPAAVLEFVDTRESWRRAEPGSVFAQYFHKKRSMVFGSRVLNNHIFFSASPVVGAKTSTFRAKAQDHAAEPREDELIAADIAYSNAPAEAPEVMLAALRALRLDVAAIDYSSLPDGSVILWEANPYFHLPPWSKGLLSGERQLRIRIEGFYRAMMDELEALAEAKRAA
jgi:hypothetical protein